MRSRREKRASIRQAGRKYFLSVSVAGHAWSRSGRGRRPKKLVTGSQGVACLPHCQHHLAHMLPRIHPPVRVGGLGKGEGGVDLGLEAAIGEEGPDGAHERVA